MINPLLDTKDPDYSLPVEEVQPTPQMAQRSVPYRLRLAFMGLATLLLAVVIILLLFRSPTNETGNTKEIEETLFLMHQDLADVRRGQLELESKLSSAISSRQHLPTTQKRSHQNETYGIDASQWKGDYIKDLPSMTKIQFVIAKATQGREFVDPEFRRSWDYLGKNPKYYRGAYHYLNWNLDGKEQAHHYFNTVKLGGAKDFPPIVDFEQTDQATLSHEVARKALREFLEETERLFGQKAWIYTNVNDADIYLANYPKFAEYPLWLADWTKSNSLPSTPEPWKSAGKTFTIWQKNSSYDVNSTEFDMDVFPHSYSDLANLVKYH